MLEHGECATEGLGDLGCRRLSLGVKVEVDEERAKVEGDTKAMTRRGRGCRRVDGKVREIAVED